MRRLYTTLAVVLPLVASAAGPQSAAERVAEGVLRLGTADGRQPVAVRTADGWLLVDSSTSASHALGDADPVRWRAATGERPETHAGAPGLLIAPSDLAGDADLSFRDRIELDGDAVVLEIGRAVTASDLVVWLPERRVLVAGDLAGPSPAVGPATDSAAWINALERLERLEPVLVVPASGPAGGGELLATRRASLAALRDGIWADLTAGRTPDAIVAARAGDLVRDAGPAPRRRAVGRSAAAGADGGTRTQRGPVTHPQRSRLEEAAPRCVA